MGEKKRGVRHATAARTIWRKHVPPQLTCQKQNQMRKHFYGMLFLDFGILSNHEKLQNYILLSQEYVVSIAKEKERVLTMN